MQPALPQYVCVLFISWQPAHTAPITVVALHTTCCCVAAGPSHPDGLHLQSKRIENGLEARIALPAKYCAFPGVMWDHLQMKTSW